MSKSRHANKHQHSQYISSPTMSLKPGAPPCRRLKEQKNLNSFFAVMFGLSNSAVHRLYKTWEVRTATFVMIFKCDLKHNFGDETWNALLGRLLQRIPSKTKRVYCAFERLMVSVLLSTRSSSNFLLLILTKRHNVVSIFSAPVRIPHGTTGPTDWLWPNSVRPTSPSCLCCSKVTGSVACEALDENVLFIKSLNTFFSHPDMTFINEGNPNYVEKLVNFEKLVRQKKKFFKCCSAWFFSPLWDKSEMFPFFPLILTAHDRQDGENSSRMQKPAVRWVIRSTDSRAWLWITHEGYLRWTTGVCFFFHSAVPSSPQRGLADRMFLEGPATRISTCELLISSH